MTKKRTTRQAVADSPAPAGPSTKQRAAIDAVIKSIRAQFGAGAISRLGLAYEETPAVLPTTLANLDRAIGVGGWPRGKLVELYGSEAVGKTTLCKFLAGVAQRAGDVTYYIDREASVDLDPQFDKRLGLDSEQLLLSKPPLVQTLEDCLIAVDTAVTALAKIKAPGFVFFDSVAAAPLKAEMDQSIEDNARPGVRAFMLGRFLPGLLAKIQGTQVAVVFVNQERERIGATGFQERTYSPGGRAFRHYAHLRLKMSAIGQIKQGDTVIGQRCRIHVRKSKIAPPRREAGLLLRYHGELLDDPVE